MKLWGEEFFSNGKLYMLLQTRNLLHSRHAAELIHCDMLHIHELSQIACNLHMITKLKPHYIRKLVHSSLLIRLQLRIHPLFKFEHFAERL